MRLKTPRIWRFGGGRLQGRTYTSLKLRKSQIFIEIISIGLLQTPMMRLFLALCISVLFTPLARADSWCQYEQNLVGTQAIGYIFPDSGDRNVYDHEKQICKIAAHTEPDKIASIELYDCGDFVHVPVPFQSNRETLKATGFEPYFGIFVFNTNDKWLALRLNSGSDVWIELKYLKAAFHHNSGVITPETAKGMQGVSLHEEVYLSPDFASGVPRPDTSAAEHETFLAETMMQLGLPAEAYRTILTSRWSQEFITFRYRVNNLIKANDGSEWFEADEHLVVDATYIDRANFPNLFENREDLPSTVRSQLYTSDEGRTIYLPFKDASGVVISIPTLGPGCD